MQGQVWLPRGNYLSTRLLYFSVFILAAMAPKPSNDLDSLRSNFMFTFFSLLMFLHVN